MDPAEGPFLHARTHTHIHTHISTHIHLQTGQFNYQLALLYYYQQLLLFILQQEHAQIHTLETAAQMCSLQQHIIQGL